jgi:hypothetical protein
MTIAICIIFVGCVALAILYASKCLEGTDFDGTGE